MQLVIDPHQMSIGAVATTINRSVARVKQLDAVLMPKRDRIGYRRYDPAVVAKYLAERDAK